MQFLINQGLPPDNLNLFLLQAPLSPQPPLTHLDSSQCSVWPSKPRLRSLLTLQPWKWKSDNKISRQTPLAKQNQGGITPISALSNLPSQEKKKKNSSNTEPSEYQHLPRQRGRGEKPRMLNEPSLFFPDFKTSSFKEM